MIRVIRSYENVVDFSLLRQTVTDWLLFSLKNLLLFDLIDLINKLDIVIYSNFLYLTFYHLLTISSMSQCLYINIRWLCYKRSFRIHSSRKFAYVFNWQRICWSYTQRVVFSSKKNSINNNDSNLERNSFTSLTFRRRQCIYWTHDLRMLILCLAKIFIKKRKEKIASKRFNKFERRFFNLNMFCSRFFSIWHTLTFKSKSNLFFAFTKT